MIYLNVIKVLRIHYKDIFKYVLNIIFNFNEIIHHFIAYQKVLLCLKCSKKYTKWHLPVYECQHFGALH